MKKLILLLFGSILYVSLAMSQDTTAVCGNFTNITADISNYSEFTWFAEEPNSTVGTFGDEHSPTTTYTAGGYGVVKFYYDANIGGNIVSDTLYIEFFALPEPTTTDGVDIACGQTIELQVFNANPDYEGRWTAYDIYYNVFPIVIYSDYDNQSSTSSNTYPHCYVTVPIPDDVAEVEYIFRWTEVVSDPRLSESCDGQAEKHIIFRKVPVVSVHQCGSTGNSMTICGNSTVELCAEIVASEGYTEYVWICNDIQGSFADPTSTSTTFTPDSDVQISTYRDVDFLFNATENGCTSTDTMHVRFLQRPTANAGLDHVACGNSYELHGEWSVSPSDDYTPTCQWTVGTKPYTYSQVTWYNTPHDSIVEHVQVSDYGAYTFIVREINTAGDAASCYGSDTVTIEFMEYPNVYAGPDFITCGLDFTMNATSSHVDGDNISGNWTCVNGTATFEDSTDPHTPGHYSAYGSARFRWTETNHPHIQTDNEEACSASDEVVVTFYEKPSASLNMNEADTVACGLITPFFLRAEEPDDGVSGYWYEENQSTVFGASNNIVTNATVSSYGRHDFYWIEYTGPADNSRMCSDTAGPWTINFIQQPDAQIAEEELTFCGYNGQIHVNFNGEGDGQWSTNVPDIVTFDETTNPNTMVQTTMLNSGSTQYPYYELYWTVTNSEYCTDKDTVRATFARIPSDSIVVIPPMCFGGPAILTAYEDSLAIYDWDFGNGFIDSIAYNSAMGEYRVIMEWYDMQTSHVVGLTTTNHWGCQSNMGRAIIEEPDLPEYDYNIISDTCALGKGGIEFMDTTGWYAFFWIDTTVGPTVTNPITGYAITDSHVYNIPAGIYTFRAEYQTFNRDYLETYRQFFGSTLCVDYAQAEVGTIGLIEAEFAISADVLEAPANAIFINATNFDNIGDHICEWYFGDDATESNCDEIVEHTYTAPGCYEPYLVVSNRNLPECRDTAWLNECVFVDVCTVWEDKDTTVNNYIQLDGHTFYTDGVYQLEIETDDTCRHILSLHYTIMNGVDEYDSDDICIFPNPTDDILHIASPVPISRVEFFSIDGRSIGIFEANESDVECDVSKFVEGVYFARIYGTDGRMCSVKKFIKE